MHPVGKRLLGLGRLLDAPAIEGEAHAVISAFDAGAAQATHRQWCEAVRTTVLEQRWHALLAPDDDHGATDQDALRHRPALDLGRQRRNIPGIREKGHGAFLPACRSAEHTSELQSLMRSSYAVFCLQKNKNAN